MHILPRSDMCELRIRSAVCMQQNQTQSETKPHTHRWARLCAFLPHIRQTASLQPSQTRPGFAPYTQRCLPTGWLPDIHTWHHRLVIRSICLLPSSPLPLSLSISRWNSFPLFIHPWLCLHIPLSVCSSLVPPFLLRHHPPPFLFFFFLSVSCFWSPPWPQRGLRC